MKVVLFCGGLGTRLREHSETIPKPLVNIGTRPILWHLMRYYAHYGHKDFVLALGYRGDAEGLLEPATNMAYGVPYLAGAYRAAHGDEARTLVLYSRGYHDVH